MKTLTVAAAMFLALTDGDVTFITESGTECELAKHGSGMSVTNIESGARFNVFPHFSKYQAITLDGEIEDVYNGDCSMCTVCDDFFDNIVEMTY